MKDPVVAEAFYSELEAAGIKLENTSYNESKESLNEVYPNKGESKKDFINRFMRATSKEYPDVKQRYAVANSYWEGRDKKKLKEDIQRDILQEVKNHLALLINLTTVQHIFCQMVHSLI